jgi:hypothetical protein
MQVLPVSDIAKIAFIDNNIVNTGATTKGKRKARVEHESAPEKEKTTRAKRAVAGSSSKNTDAMDVA